MWRRWVSVCRDADEGLKMFWRYIKHQAAAEMPRTVWRFCYEVRPDVYAAVRVCWN